MIIYFNLRIPADLSLRKDGSGLSTVHMSGIIISHLNRLAGLGKSSAGKSFN